jgi:hypothetical protein
LGEIAPTDPGSNSPITAACQNWRKIRTDLKIWLSSYLGFSKFFLYRTYFSEIAGTRIVKAQNAGIPCNPLVENEWKLPLRLTHIVSEFLYHFELE